MRVIRLCVETGFANCKHEDEQAVPDDWDAMTPAEQEAYLDECAQIFLANHVVATAWVEEVP